MLDARHRRRLGVQVVLQLGAVGLAQGGQADQDQPAQVEVELEARRQVARPSRQRASAAPPAEDRTAVWKAASCRADPAGGGRQAGQRRLRGRGRARTSGSWASAATPAGDRRACRRRTRRRRPRWAAPPRPRRGSARVPARRRGRCWRDAFQMPARSIGSDVAGSRVRNRSTEVASRCGTAQVSSSGSRSDCRLRRDETGRGSPPARPRSERPPGPGRRRRWRPGTGAGGRRGGRRAGAHDRAGPVRSRVRTSGPAVRSQPSTKPVEVAGSGALPAREQVVHRGVAEPVRPEVVDDPAEEHLVAQLAALSCLSRAEPLAVRDPVEVLQRAARVQRRRCPATGWVLGRRSATSPH